MHSIVQIKERFYLHLMLLTVLVNLVKYRLKLKFCLFKTFFKLCNQVFFRLKLIIELYLLDVMTIEIFLKLCVFLNEALDLFLLHKLSFKHVSLFLFLA